MLDDRASALFKINQRLVTQYESASKKTKEIEFLHEVTTLAIDRIPIKEALKKFLKLVCQLCQWPIGHVYWPKIINDEECLVSSKIWFFEKEEPFFHLIKVSESYIFKKGEDFPGKIYQMGESSWLKDLNASEHFLRKNFLGGSGLKSVFGMPLKMGQKMMAVLEFFSDKSIEKEYSRMPIVDTAAVQLGSLLERNEIEFQLKENFEALQKTQLKLIRSEKMASLGMISAGIAHEINNPLSFVLSNIQTLLGYFSSLEKMTFFYQDFEKKLKAFQNENIQKEIDKINDLKKSEDIDYLMQDCPNLIQETLCGISRVKEIVQNLKTFSRVDEAEMKEADINECIEATLKVIFNELKYKCTIEKEFGFVPKIICYPGQLIQVFTNLLMNAAQAIEKNGAIKIKTEADKEKIQIFVSDTGKGIAPESMKNLFTPFFTTKAVGKGTGLGLSISYGIIKKHGGLIDVKSVVNVGTTFVIELPLKNFENPSKEVKK